MHLFLSILLFCLPILVASFEALIFTGPEYRGNLQRLNGDYDCFGIREWQGRYGVGSIRTKETCFILYKDSECKGTSVKFAEAERWGFYKMYVFNHPQYSYIVSSAKSIGTC